MIKQVLKYLYLGAGLTILVWVVAETDIAEVLRRIAELGWLGLLFILGLYFIAFFVDSITWLLTLESANLTFRWGFRVFIVRLAGEAFNNLLPGATMGGEPLKALMIKEKYGISLNEGSASLVLAKTLNLIALVLFLLIGVFLVTGTSLLSSEAKFMSHVGLCVLITGTIILFCVQRFGFSSRLGVWLASFSNSNKPKVFLKQVEEIDSRFKRFYSSHRTRVLVAIILAFLNWTLGVAEVYFAMNFVGYPIEWSDAWIIEAAAQMVRAAVFFIPAGIGAQEGVFLFLSAAMTGNPSLGLAIAVIRRVREITWIAIGVAIAFLFSNSQKE